MPTDDLLRQIADTSAIPDLRPTDAPREKRYARKTLRPKPAGDLSEVSWQRSAVIPAEGGGKDKVTLGVDRRTGEVVERRELADESEKVGMLAGARYLNDPARAEYQMEVLHGRTIEHEELPNYDVLAIDQDNKERARNEARGKRTFSGLGGLLGPDGELARRKREASGY